MILDAGEPVDLFPKVTTGKMKPVYATTDLVARLTPIKQLPEIVLIFSYVTRCTSLHTAAFFGNLQAIELLIERGADVNSTASPKGMTPLILASIAGRDDACAL